jgi:hypothetical protein
VHHRDAESLRCASRRESKVLTRDVRVVQAEELDREFPEVALLANVREVIPAVGLELVAEIGRAAGACPV